MVLQDDVEELIANLNKLANEKASLKGEITTNAKGEASFKVRVYSELASEIETQAGQILDGLEKVCNERSIPIAGRS